MPSRREIAAALRFMAPLDDPPEKRSPGAGGTGAMSFHGDTVDPTPQRDAAQAARDGAA